MLCGRRAGLPDIAKKEMRRICVVVALVLVPTFTLASATPALAGPGDVEAVTSFGTYAPAIVITATEATGGALDPEQAYYNLDQPADVLTAIIWNDASAVDSIVEGADNTLVEDVHYTVGIVNGKATLTILDTYLAGELLAVGDEVQLTISFDSYTPAIFTITAISEQMPVQYVLTIFSSTGGSVTEPGEGAFTYDAGTVVDLVARPDEGYRFFRWMGDVGTVADVAAASTNITMQGSYNITANFGAEIVLQRSVNWPLIVGIMAAAIVTGLLVFFVRKRRVALREGR